MPHLLQLLVLLSLVIAASKLAGAAATRVGQPAVFGEVLMGLILGPTVLNVLGWNIFHPHADGALLLDSIRDLADIGVILLMLIAGLETDLDEMRRSKTVAFWVAAGGVILPMFGGTLAAVAFGLPLRWEGIFVGTILTATSVSITAQTLLELGTLRSRVGATILAAAVIDDILGIIVLSVVVALARTGGTFDPRAVAMLAVRIAVFFVIAVLGGRWLNAVARESKKLNISQGLISAVVVVALIYAWAAEYIGSMAAITGSYVAGVLFARTPYKREIDQGIHPLTYSVLVPVFFVSIGLQANGRDLGSQVGFTLALLAVAIAGKALGCGVPARLSGLSARESAQAGVGMISRGEVGLIVAGYGLEHQIIGHDIFSASVVIVLVTTMLTPPLLRLTFPGRRVRRQLEIEETIGHRPEETKGTR